MMTEHDTPIPDEMIERLNDAASLYREDWTVEPGYEGLAAVTLGEILAAYYGWAEADT